MKKYGLLDNIRLINIEILCSVWKYIKKHDSVDERENYNYLSNIRRDTGWSYDSVIKVIDILERMGLVRKESNGRKKVYHVKVSQK